MRLLTVSTGSQANCYVLNTEKEDLVIENGATPMSVKKALDFNIGEIVGSVVSHRHSDHARYVSFFKSAGIPVFQPYNKNDIKQSRKYGKFRITAFPLVHDVPCFGFLIYHPEMGNLLYASDTAYIKYKFKNLNHILVECNHDIVDEEAVNFEHTVTGHMSLSTCKDFITANNHKNLKNVILCHMSDKNIDELKAVQEIQELTKGKVWSAHSSKDIDISLIPF